MVFSTFSFLYNSLVIPFLKFNSDTLKNKEQIIVCAIMLLTSM